MADNTSTGVQAVASAGTALVSSLGGLISWVQGAFGKYGIVIAGLIGLFLLGKMFKFKI